MENNNFSVKCCLLAFLILALGQVVSLELFVSRGYCGVLWTSGTMNRVM